MRVLEVRVGPFTGVPDTARHLLELFDEIPGLGEMRPLDGGVPVEGLHRFCVKTTCTDEELLDLFSFHVERRLVRLAPLAGGPVARAPAEVATLRLPVDKVDRLVGLVGELVLLQTRLIQESRALPSATHAALLATIGQSERHVRDLHNAMLSIRMAPVSGVFGRFPRMLRDLCAKRGRQIELVTQGDTIELDRGLLQKLVDPLAHLVRSACDDGFEPALVRPSRGKPPHGTITLSAWHQGHAVVIEVRDDGHGLADERSLVGVKRAIAALGGRVEVEAVPGRGQSAKVRLPLPLALLDGLCLAVRTEVCVLPMALVAATHRIGADTVRSNGQGVRVANVRGEVLPVVDLGDRLGWTAPAGAAEPMPSIMAIVESEGVRVAVLADGLVGRQTVVVRRPGHPVKREGRRLPDVSAMTTLGNGRAAFVLDVGALLAVRR